MKTRKKAAPKKTRQQRCSKCGSMMAKKVGGGQVGWRCRKCHPAAPQLEWKLGEMMVKKGLTIGTLAEAAGLSYRETGRIVRGQVVMMRVETIGALAHALGCKPGAWWS